MENVTNGNVVSDVELIIDVKTTLPIINSNFEFIKEKLTNGLKKYDVTVDEDGVKEAKSMATEINKLSNQIDTLRKEKVNELYAPIKNFELKAKELVQLCQKSRANLLEQIELFDNRKREECLRLLRIELSTQYERFSVRADFQNVKIEDLALISNLNKTGLAKKAVDTVSDRVLLAKRFQEKIDHRVLSLDGSCFKNGLAAPLTVDHIKHFLMLDNDEQYERELNLLIKRELTRQEQIKKTIIEQNEIEAKVEQPQPLVIKEEIKEEPKIKLANDGLPIIEVQPVSIQYQNQTKEPENSEVVNVSDNIKRYTVTATFEIDVDERLETKLKDMLLRKFEKACFKTVPEIKIIKH